MTLGGRIREFRAFAAVTQTDLAQRVGISGGSLCQIELNNRQPSEDTFEKLAVGMGMSVRELAGEQTDRELLVTRNSRELLRHFAGLSPGTQRRLLQLVRFFRWSRGLES